MRYLLIVLLLFLGCDDNPASPQIKGCTDVSACNYDDTATTEDESCAYAQENYDCDNNCIADLDCVNECGGTATLDECGVCNGEGPISYINQECENEYICQWETITTWLGSDSYCHPQSCQPYSYCSSNSYCYNSGGFAFMGCDNSAQCITHEQDTEYVCDWQEICEDVYVTECLGNYDCAGIEFGPNYPDNCGVCDDDQYNDCIQDCNGNWGGITVEDCSGTCGGSAVEDECGVCDGSGIAEGACDCDGNVDLGCGCGQAGPSGCDNACGGSAVVDECGVCGGSNLSCTDCLGVVNGDAVLDECGVCDGPGDVYECGCYNIPDGKCVCSEDFYSCYDIEVLQDIIDANNLNILPLELGVQSWNIDGRLYILNLSSIQISILPESIENINSLFVLNLSGNELSSLPQNLCNLPQDCIIYVVNNELCEEYHYDCIDNFNSQDQSNCCPGTNNSGELDPNWTNCP